jgi:hypothetical protein
MVDLSPEARERAVRTTLAAPVFAGQAASIAEGIQRLGVDVVLVCIVDADMQYAGQHVVAVGDLVAEVARLEDDPGGGGWAMVFSAGVDEAEVLRRCAEMVAIAAARVEVLDRLSARREAAGGTAGAGQ